ncbi:glycosyltransferase family 39 protein [Thiolapillus sp.]
MEPQRRINISPWWVLLPLMLVLAASYPFSLVTIDTGRDWARAWQIASGDAFPLQGPLLKSAVHFGPLWFYLLGFFLYLGKSISLATLLLGALVSLKFWLAYILGRELLDRRLGLLWALALALPNWNFMGQITFTHFNLVEPVTLWFLYALVRYLKTDEGIWLSMAMLIFSLALHAHPSTLSLGFIGVGAWIANWHRTRHLHPAWLMLGMVLFLLPFAPYLFDQYQQGWPDIQALQHMAGQEIGNTANGGLLQLFYGLLILPERIIEFHLIPSFALLPLLWKSLAFLLLGTGIAGLPLVLRDIQSRKLLAILLLSLSITLAGTVLLRKETSYYMAFVNLPFFAGLWALGTRSLLQALPGWQNRLLYLISLLILLVFAISTLSIVRVNTSGEGSFPGKLMADIRSSAIPAKAGKRGMRFASVYQDELGRYLCANMPGDSSLLLHGTLALIVDTSYGVAMRLHCNSSLDRLMLSGKGDAADRHLTGLLLRLWNQIGLHPKAIIGPLGIGHPARILHPKEGHRLPPLQKFPPHTLKPPRPSPRQWSFTTRCEEYLIISNPLGWYMRHRIDWAKVNGKKVTPVATTRFATAWHNDQCTASKENHWQFQLRSSMPQWLDIYTLSADTPTLVNTP